MEESNSQSKYPGDDTIDLIEVALKIWGERKIIFRTVGVFFILGLVIAIGSKKEYTSEVTIINESSVSSSAGMFQQLSNLAGINLSNAEKNPLQNPAIFPEIIGSTPFLMKLNEEELYFQKYDKKISLNIYFTQYDRKPIIKRIKKYISGLLTNLFVSKKGKRSNSVIPIETSASYLLPTSAERYANTMLQSRISIMQENTGILKISVKMPDPVAAYELVNLVEKNLTQYLIDYKIRKALMDLEFTKARFKESENAFINAQNALARFRDQNLNIVTSSAKNEEEKLRSEYNIKFNVYNELATSLERANIRVQELTPVFNIIDTASIPVKHFKPNVTLTLFLSVFLGIFLSLTFIILKMIYKKLRTFFVAHKERL